MPATTFLTMAVAYSLTAPHYIIYERKCNICKLPFMFLNISKELKTIDSHRIILYIPHFKKSKWH